MINLYLVDFDKKHKNNGLSTYVNELGSGLINNPNIKMHFVWINCLKHKVFTKELIGNIAHLYIPKIVNSPTEANAFDLKLAVILAEDMQGKENLIVHINWINHCSLAWYLKQKATCKVILTKHCIPWRDLVTNNYKQFYELDRALNRKEKIQIVNPLFKKEQINYECIDHIITVTNCAKTSLNILFDVPIHKITVINNGIDGKVFRKHTQSQKDKLRKKYGFCLNEKIIFFAGNVNQRKGVVELVKVFEQIVSIKAYQNTRLVIAGPGDFALVLTSAKKHWAKITLTGSLGKANLYDFYAMADIGIVPSYIEQCSYTAIEMMHSGLPIIVSNVDGLKEMVQDDCGLRVKVNYRKIGASVDIQDLKSKIVYFLDNEGQAVKLAINAKRYAKTNFSAKTMLQKTLDVYAQFAESEDVDLVCSSEPKMVYSLSSSPVVSVVLPCYNASNYLQECLDSIFAQTFTDFELILIDDGSVDGTESIIKSNTDPRLIYIKNKSNRGVIHSLNKGIKLAKGEYIARMDADDIMAKNRLQIQVDFLEINSDHGMVGSWHNVINSDGMLIGKVQNPVESDELRLLLLFRNQFAHTAITMRTNLAKKLLYDDDFKYCEDYELWTRMTEHAKVANLPYYLLSYRVHDKNSSGLNFKIVKQNTIVLLSRELDKLQVEHSPEELMLHAAVCFGMVSILFKNKEEQIVLHQWHDKVFASPILNQRYDKDWLLNFRKNILRMYCGVN